MLMGRRSARFDPGCCCMGTTLNLQWRANVFSHLVRLPVQYFEKRHLGDVVSRFGAIGADSENPDHVSFLEAILDGLMAAVTLVMMFIYSPPWRGSPSAPWVCMHLAAGRGIGHCATRRKSRSCMRPSSRHFISRNHAGRAGDPKLFQRRDERRSSWFGLVVDQITLICARRNCSCFTNCWNGLLFGIEKNPDRLAGGAAGDGW